MIIEKNIPIPSGDPRGAKRKYPFPDMEVGDSIFFDNEPKASQSKPAVAAHNYGHLNEKKFSARKEGDGVRIWRTA